jgi:hypothetical protein
MINFFAKHLIKSVLFWTVGLIVIGAFFYVHDARNGFPRVSENKWQAVFLNSGQVYFGKLSDAGNGYVSLSDVYYLKSASELEQSNLNLVKLGGELHGPEDTIYIRKESISFWENMKDTSRVVQSIAGSKQ